MGKLFHLEIITPEKIFFNGDVEAVSVDSTDGRVEVLSGHVPSVIAVVSGAIAIKQNDAWREAACSNGFMEVRPDKVILLLETAEWPEEIDKYRAQRDAEIAFERLRQQKSRRAYRESKATLARAMARLRVSDRNSVNMD